MSGARLHVDSPYSLVISVENRRFKDLTEEDVNKVKAEFKKIDVDGDNFLSLFEVQRMFEGLGTPKPTTEVRQIIAEVDVDKDGKISFYEFLLMLTGGQQQQQGADVKSNASSSVMGRALVAGLADRSLFFASAIDSQRDRLEQTKEKIKEEAALRRQEREARKVAEEAEKKRKEEEESKKKESRARLAERAALFQQSQAQ